MIRFRKLHPDVQENLPKLKEYFEKQLEISVVYLFGSLARGEKRPLSDMDIAVLFSTQYKNHGFFLKKLRLMNELINIIDVEEIDLVILNQCPVSLAFHAISERHILYEREPPQRIAFETSIIHKYLDFSYFRQIQQKYMLEQLKEGTYFEQ